MTKRSSIALAALTLLSACALRPPPIEDAPLRAQAPLSITGPAMTDGTAGVWPSGDWWRRYQDPTLDGLMTRALDGAPSLNVAAARIASARQSVRISGAALGARVEAQASLSRQRLSDNGLFPPELIGFNWYNQADLGLNVTYSFDWWGRQRSTIEAALDEARAAQAEGAAANLALTGAVAQAYFGWQADASRAALAGERLALLETQERIARRRTEAELDSGESAHVAAQALAAAREELALIEGSQRLRIVTLAALLGVSASDLPRFEPRALPPVPGMLPAQLSLDLVARRPEVQASRWRVEAARQELRAVRAEYYPDVSLRALVGLSSIEIGRLLEGGSAAPQFSAAVHLPLFDGGLRNARFGARQAQVDAAIAEYDQSIVDAAREVSAAATRLTQAAAQRTQRRAQQVAADQLLRAASARVRAGTTDLRPQLQAELALLAERDAALQFDHALIDADVALQQALGGGYVSTGTTEGNATP